jgi:hypothetical protein
VARIAANDVKAAVTADQLAVLADTLDAGSNLHRSTLSAVSERAKLGNCNCSKWRKGNKAEKF